MLKVKKIVNASQSYGRGIDNTRTPARYEISMNGLVIGTIYSKPVRSFGIACWELYPTTDFKWLNMPPERKLSDLTHKIEHRLYSVCNSPKT